MTTTVKIVFQDDIRRLTLPKQAPFDSLLSELKKIYPGVKGALNFRYRDDENDLVTVTSNMELIEATETCNGTLKLQVSVRAEAKAEKAGSDSVPVESDGEFVKVSKDGQRTANIISKESKELKEAEEKAAKKEAEMKRKAAENAAKAAAKKAAKEKKEKEKAAEKEKERKEKAARKQKAAEEKAAKKALEKAEKKAKKNLHESLGATFVKDLTIPDNMEVEVGSKVVKTWLIKNSGTVAWPKGTKFGTVAKNGATVLPDCKVPAGLKPGQEAAISVSLTIAPKPGKYRSQEYSLVFEGKPFGHTYFAIVVAVAKPQKKPEAKKVPVWPVRKTKAPVQDKKAKKAAPVPSEYGAQFVKDVSIIDGTVVAPGQKLVKKWLIRNTGEKAWPKGTKLVSLPKSTFGKTVEVEVKGVGKDQTIELVASLVAPQKTGPHTARFQLALPTGEKFGHKYWVNIAVSKFPNRAQLKAMFMEFIADPKVVDLLQSELPSIIKEIRQGKKMASIVKLLVEKHKMLADHQFIIFVQPFLHSAEKFMQMQIDALISMYSVWAMTPFSNGAAQPAQPEAKADVKKEAKKATPLPGLPGPKKKNEDVKKPQAKPQPKPKPKKAYKYDAALEAFKAMGFKNLEVIKTLLDLHKGNVESVTQALFSS